jgi:hypothetical protein
MALGNFLSGMATLGFLISGLFFLRFWKRTGDALFLAFAIAFGLMGIGQAVTTLANSYLDDSSVTYLIRLAAFALIIVAIWRKNNAPK